VGYKPIIPVFERTKTVHALGRAVTVTGYKKIFNLITCKKSGSKWSWSFLRHYTLIYLEERREMMNTLSQFGQSLGYPECTVGALKRRRRRAKSEISR
jgi:hypothetical protein